MINKDKSIALYKALADSNKERVFEMTHASSLAACPRMQFYKFMAIPSISEPATGAKVIRWQAGHNLEAAIRPSIEKVYGGLASNERMTSKKWMLTGEFDNLVIADNRLVEIKSVHEFAFIQRDNELSLKEQVGTKMGKYHKETKVFEPKLTPYLGHEIQNHAYVLLLEEQGKKVEHIDYVYISLGGRLVVYSTEVQDSIMQNAKNRLEALKTAYKTKEPPICICKPNHPLYDSTMQFCDYKKTPYGEPDPNCCSLDLMK